MKAFVRVCLCSTLAALNLPAQAERSIAASPRTVERGQTVLVTIVNRPSAPAAKIWLGEYRLRDIPLTGTDPIPVTVPVTLEDTIPPAAPANDEERARLKRPFPLGVYPIRVELGNYTWVTADPITVIPLRGSTLEISQVTPRFSYLEGRTASLIIYGSGFATRWPSDNVVLLNRAEQQVIWNQGCDPAGWKKGETAELHGVVRSSRQIDLCNVPVGGDSEMTVGIRQGAAEARLDEPVRFTTWSRRTIVLLSLGVALLIGVIVVVLVASQRDTPEGYFRTIFLDLETNTYSLSKLQFYLWTGAAIFSYMYFALAKLLVQFSGNLPPVPGTLPGIVAIGAGTAIGAQVVSGFRGPKGAGAENPRLSDLITSGGVVAADRVQLLAWTVVTVLGYLAAVLREDPSTMSSLPVIPENLMYLSGLSSVGYLGAKFARKPGPVIDELSLRPAASEKALAPAAQAPAAVPVQLEQPIAAARQSLAKVRAAAAASGAAPQAASRAVTVLETGISEAAALAAGTVQGGLTKLDSLASAAREAAASAAADFERVAGVTSPDAEALRQSAAVSQLAAGAIEDLSAGVGQAFSESDVALRRRGEGFRRVIEIRGRNLSADGTFTISAGKREYDVPSRMLEEVEDKRGNLVRAPVLVVPEEDTGTPNIGRMLRLVIPRDELEPVDRKAYEAWFGQDQQQLTFTINNPDGQKATVSFNIPQAARRDN